MAHGFMLRKCGLKFAHSLAQLVVVNLRLKCRATDERAPDAGHHFGEMEYGQRAVPGGDKGPTSINLCGAKMISAKEKKG